MSPKAALHPSIAPFPLLQKYEFYPETLRDAYNPQIVFQDVSVHLTKRGQCAMGGDMATAYANSGLHH